MNDTTGEFAVEAPFTVGARLAEARKAHALDLADIAARTRVPLRHLEAIEAGDIAALPAVPYSVGFVRAFAQIVGLDANALAREFREEMGGGQPERIIPEPFEPADPARVPSRFLVTVAIVVAIVLGGAYALWRSGALTGSGDEERVASATPAQGLPEPTPPPASVAPPAPTPAGGPVVLTALEPVWLRVSDGGTRLIEKQLNVGETWEVPATAADPRILTGRPQALRVTVGSAVIPPLGAPERTIRDVSLKADALLARLNPPTASAAPVPAPAPAAALPGDPAPVLPNPAPINP
ncbi:MAG: helix-turn-helix domain-containing protein [Sphingomonas sp.]|nr:helix-turn-helix domain-containing protein [Sphingomonas sp.]MDX3885253.1 helix-turn-helix domain-containing protein [Sphingomonas sp.]